MKLVKIKTEKEFLDSGWNKTKLGFGKEGVNQIVNTDMCDKILDKILIIEYNEDDQIWVILEKNIMPWVISNEMISREFTPEEFPEYFV